MYYDDYWAVKEIPNTIGFSPFEVSKRANFSGYIRDKNDEPIASVVLKYDDQLMEPYIETDTNGYFTASGEMFCRIFNIQFLCNGGQIGDTIVSIEPDSANYYEFKLDTLLTGIKEIQSSTFQYSIFNTPNPSSSQTKFIIESDDPEPGTTGVIKIYSETGYIVDIVPVEIINERQEISFNFNTKSLSSGRYFYTLELNNHKVASGKMIISQ